MNIFKLRTIKILASALCSLVIACALSSNVSAADSLVGDDRDISRYYQISSDSLVFLKQIVTTKSNLFAAKLKKVIVLEDYIAALTAPGYVPYIKGYVTEISTSDLNLLIDAEFLKFYNVFIDKISDEEFAAIFRQYLGELTASYLMSPTEQDFTEFVLSRTLRLTQQDYSNLYRDYISTLWKYYVSSATSEELTEILGDDYLKTLSSANMAVEDDRYFAVLAEHITSISESDFISDYGVYITETVGGLLADSLAAAPEGGLPIDAPPAQESVAPNSAAGTAGEPESESESSFTELSTQESVRLIRRHIASVAKSYFLNPFKQDLINVTSSYTVEVDSSQLIPLFGIEDFKSLVGSELTASNARNKTKLDSLTMLSDDIFLGDLRFKLRLVENIPYPNLRLLKIAVNHALDSYSAVAISTEKKLSDDQFNILLGAILDTIRVYDASGPVLGSELPPVSEGDTEPAPAAAAVPAPAAVPATSGDIRWKFPGCGCEIDDANSIYGFYPSWAVPKPGSEPQQIDLRYYNRVAYFGLSIDERGFISDDDDWKENGPLNDFILDAHIRMTRIDLGIYARNWQKWQESTLTTRVDNIVDKLSIPLNSGLMTSFASKYLPYVYPTFSETIGKDSMGDGVTIYFDNLESSKLDVINRFISALSHELERSFPEGVPPINLMFDLEKNNSLEILTLLRPLIIGSQANMNRYVERVLIFLEQDTWASSQAFIESVKTVFKDDDSAAVLKKIIPILIPAKDPSNKLTLLSRDLRDLRGTFGNAEDAGGAAIWPIPIDNPEEGLLVDSLAIKGALNSAMTDDDTSADGFWKNLQAGVRVPYFESRLWLIFSMTAIYSISMLILLWSIREPIRPIILMTAKILGGFTFVLFMLSRIFIDPYINPWRIVFFLLPILIVFFIVPLQSAVPSVNVSPNITGNRYVKRKIKMQKSRVLRSLRRKVKQGIWNHNDS